MTVVDVRNPATPVDVAWAGTATFAGSYTIGYQPLGIALLGGTAHVTTPWSLVVYGALNPPCSATE